MGRGKGGHRKKRKESGWDGFSASRSATCAHASALTKAAHSERSCVASDSAPQHARGGRAGACAKGAPRQSTPLMPTSWSPTCAQPSFVSFRRAHGG